MPDARCLAMSTKQVDLPVFATMPSTRWVLKQRGKYSNWGNNLITKWNKPGWFPLSISVAVNHAVNDGIDKGNHPGLFHLVVSSVASLTLLGSCSQTEGHRVAICSVGPDCAELSVFRLLQICLLGSARLRRNETFCYGLRKLINWTNLY